MRLNRSTHRSIVGLSLLVAACLPATALWATIGRARITDRDKTGNGTLRLTIEGKETVHVAKGVSKAWVIEDGGAVIYALDGGREMDYHTHTLLRHDELGSGDGDMELLKRFCEIKDVKVWHSVTGKPALIVYGEQDNTGSPAAAIVHPERGVVWRGLPARVVGLKGGLVRVAQYAPEAGLDPKDKPLRTITVDLDAVLKGPVLKPMGK